MFCFSITLWIVKTSTYQVNSKEIISKCDIILSFELRILFLRRKMNSVCYDNIPLHRSNFNVHLDNCWHYSRFCVLQLNILGERRAIWYTFIDQQLFGSSNRYYLQKEAQYYPLYCHMSFHGCINIFTTDERFFACASFYNILLLKGAPALLHVRGKEYT